MLELLGFESRQPHRAPEQAQMSERGLAPPEDDRDEQDEDDWVDH